MFFSTTFTSNNQIIGNCQVPVLLEKTQGEKVLRGIANMSTLLRYSLGTKTIVSLRPYENEADNGGVSPMSGNILSIDPDTVVAPYTNFSKMKGQQYDKIKTIGLYDYEGKKISIALRFDILRMIIFAPKNHVHRFG